MDREALVRLDAQLRTLDGDYNRLAAELRRPASTVVIDRSAFLNLLLQRKGISWTRLFSDLESGLPRGSPAGGCSSLPDGRQSGSTRHDRRLGDAGAGDSTDSEAGGLAAFGATSVLSSQPPSQNEPLYRYRVSVSYAQKL